MDQTLIVGTYVRGVMRSTTPSLIHRYAEAPTFFEGTVTSNVGRGQEINKEIINTLEKKIRIKTCFSFFSVFCLEKKHQTIFSVHCVLSSS